MLPALALLVVGCAFPPPAYPTPTPLLLSDLAEFHIHALDFESQPTGITAGHDGAVWFTELAADGHIGRITSAGALTEFRSTTAAQGITAGPDGALWFTSLAADGRIGRITPAGAVTEFALPVPNSVPQDITAGPDGALWFTEANVTVVPGGAIINEIGRITTSGIVTEFPLTPSAYPQGITSGPDGALWFTEAGGNQIGRITLSGAITEFAIPTARSYPQRITTGPDGALWFTESGSNKIGRITTAGAVTEFTIPAGGAPWGITAGPDGAVWFTEGFGPVLGRLTVTGVFSNLGEPIPSYYASGEAPARPRNTRGITVGPDGALWFTEAGVNAIFRVGLAPAAARPRATSAAPAARPIGPSAASPGLAWRETERTPLFAAEG
jgi:virginiamycin B lyase